jgi:hypothetical protein
VECVGGTDATRLQRVLLKLEPKRCGGQIERRDPEEVNHHLNLDC